MVLKVTTIPEYERQINTDAVVLVDFFADWCGPCKAVAPILEDMEKTYETGSKKVTFLKVNVDEMSQLAGQLEIAAMPTFLVYQGGVLKKKIVGANVPEIQSTLTELTNAGTQAAEAIPV